MKFDITVVLNVAVSMFIVMVVGYFLRRKDIIDSRFSKNLSKLVLHVTQPVLIVSSMMKMEMTADNNKLLGKILLVSFGIHTFAAVFGWISMRFMKDCNSRKLSEHSIIFTNVLFFGLPIVQNVFGDDAAAWASFFSIIFHVFAWTYGMIILGRDRDDIKLNPGKVILNYGTVPCIIGVIMYFIKAGSWIPASVMTAMGYIGGLCTPVSLLVLGGVLATHPPKRLFCDVKVYYVSFIKLLVLPIIVYIMTKYALKLDMEMCIFAIIMAALPTASITNMFAELYDIEPGYAATCVGMTTALSVVTIPLMVFITRFI